MGKSCDIRCNLNVAGYNLLYLNGVACNMVVEGESL